MELFCISVLQEPLHGDGYEGHDLLLQADHHAVEELADTGVEELALDGSIEGLEEDL